MIVSDQKKAQRPRSRRASGFGKILVAIYGIFALAATARAAYQIATKFSDASVAYLLSALAALVYIVATFSLARRGERAFLVTLIAMVVELCGVIIIGLMSIIDTQAFPHDTVWSYFGRGYGFVPLILPIVGLWWLWRNRDEGSSDTAEQTRIPASEKTENPTSSSFKN